MQGLILSEFVQGHKKPLSFIPQNKVIQINC